ncbi:glutamate synthase [Novosphingobium sp. Rr 2-17]|uniref:nuclear transport factor 2 family protein n=1 Tax=Novosphingobium sp. Rr 2-17 TaxID=555793 RepID=UPI0002699BC5|nr:nuclear transport factor 2 family protein [Novosphingobium sp. Rr 2-17]EIZ78796.1 glutamate synthase [Novosphingobium sp. Rr 2-17]
MEAGVTQAGVTQAGVTTEPTATPDVLAELAALRAQVALLSAKDEIADLVTTYARACDVGNDPVLLRPLFTDDATWHCKGFGTFTGGDGCALGLKAVAGEKIWWSLHNMISVQITLDPSGEEATGFWYLWEAATLPDEHTGEATAHWIGGTYDARFRKVDGKWRFSKIELKLNMSTPIAQGWVKKRWPDGTRKQPYFVNLKPGETYYWCKCGKSATQPFCDGSHQSGKVEPVSFSVEEGGLQAVCGCRYSKTKPLCDGSHLNLKYDWSLLGKTGPDDAA